MRLMPLFACATLLAAAVGSTAAAERCASPGAGSVWIEGNWQQSGSQYSWCPGYWQTSTTTVYATQAPTPSPAWVEGRWAQGTNGWVWVEGHYEEAPTYAPQQVVYTPPPQVVYAPPPVVYVQPRPCPQTTVVVSSGYGGYNGYNGGYGNGYYRPACPPPVTYCPPPVAYCPPPVAYCPPARPHVTVGVALPLPSIGFPSINVGNHRLPVPIPVPIFRNQR